LRTGFCAPICCQSGIASRMPSICAIARPPDDGGGIPHTTERR
jgi:hypothetical protein